MIKHQVFVPHPLQIHEKTFDEFYVGFKFSCIANVIFTLNWVLAFVKDRVQIFINAANGIPLSVNFDSLETEIGFGKALMYCMHKKIYSGVSGKQKSFSNNIFLLLYLNAQEVLLHKTKSCPAQKGQSLPRRLTSASKIDVIF